MNRVTITIHVDLPDGVVPDVGYGDALPQEPPELMEAARQIFAEQPAYDPDQIIRPAATAHPGCPQHGAMERFPAGTSKKTGKAYGASWRCPVAGCTTKPIWDKAA